MRKAIVILATSVAFLLSGQAFAVRQPVNMPLEGELIRGAETVDTIGDGIRTTKTLPTVNVNVSGKNLPVPVSAVRNVPTSRIVSLAKNGIKNNLASIAVTASVTALLAGVDWVMTDGVVSKRTLVPSASGATGNYYWNLTGTSMDTVGSSNWSSPFSLCTAFSQYRLSRDSAANPTYSWSVTSSSLTLSGTSATCVTVTTGVKAGSSNYSRTNTQGMTRGGTGCYGQGETYIESAGTCGVTQLIPVTDSDYDVLDGFIKGKDGVWQRGLASEICDSLPNPEQCYKGLVSDGTLTGPSTVTGSPTTTTSTSSTTNPDGTVTSPSTSTSTQSPTITITYGDTYFDYSPTTTTTTTTNNNGSTTTTTETEEGGVPDVPDSLAGINDPLGGLPGEIEGQGSSVSPLGYHSWFSMGGSCKEHSFDLPVIGVLTTNYCPIHEAYVRPFLAFMFAVWTWHYCFQIWRESVTRVRAD